METSQTIFKRRSIRKYKETPLTQEQITKILKAAMASPTARNVQDWEFLVVTSKEGREKIMQSHPYAKALETAPAAIILCSNKEREMPAEGYAPINGGAAMQNMLLCATDMGLGSLWLGVAPRQERMDAIKEAFSLPNGITPIAIAVFGYSDEQKEDQDRYDEKKVHNEQW